MPSARALPGLPPYGPLAEAFSPSGTGVHREGFVVEFSPDDAPTWVGNFQEGTTELRAILREPGTDRTIVIAGGTAYVVDVSTHACAHTFGGAIQEVFQVQEHLLMFSNGLWIEAHGPSGLVWRTRRVSWDGMRDLRLDGDALCGEAYDPMNDEWAPFAVDVRTGEVTGGSYPRGLP
jgi:hypothetical protein